MILSNEAASTVIAYIDPGSGMLMLQMLGGALLGAWFYFRRSIARLASRLAGRNRARATADAPIEPTLGD